MRLPDEEYIVIIFMLFVAFICMIGTTDII